MERYTRARSFNFRGEYILSLELEPHICGRVCRLMLSAGAHTPQDPGISRNKIENRKKKSEVRRRLRLSGGSTFSAGAYRILVPFNESSKRNDGVYVKVRRCF